MKRGANLNKVRNIHVFKITTQNRRRVNYNIFAMLIAKSPKCGLKGIIH